MKQIFITTQTANYMPGQTVTVTDGVARILTAIGKAKYVSETEIKPKPKRKPRRSTKQDTDD